MMVKRIWTVIAPWLFLGFAIAAVFNAGYRYGRSSGFREGSAEMKAAIFGAIDKLANANPTNPARDLGER